MTAQPAVEKLEKTVFFGTAEVQGAGRALSGANLTCGFSSVRIDLRQAELAASEVRLELFALCSSVELRVPASWRVVTDLQPLFGSADERGLAPNAAEGAPTLHIGGSVIFASFELERF